MIKFTQKNDKIYKKFDKPAIFACLVGETILTKYNIILAKHLKT